MKENFFYEVIILILTMLFILFMGVAFEKDREHRLEMQIKNDEIYKKEIKISDLAFQLREATWQIELNNKERAEHDS